MKKIMFILLVFCYSITHAQFVPDTNTFSLQTVVDGLCSAGNPVDACGSLGTPTSLQECFAMSNYITSNVADYFDPTYEGIHDRLSNFRNYGYNPAGCVSIGDAYGGGTVFYVLQVGDPGHVPGECHGFIAAAADEADSYWGCQETSIAGAGGVALNTGAQNTLDILAGCPTLYIAARRCSESTSGGQTDWFLPSKDELNKLHVNKSISTFASDYYWSSSETSASHALAQSFGTGVQSNISKNGSVDHVRCIRSF